MKERIEKAHTLIEALPYIREFYGKTIVVKYGGGIVGQELKNFAHDIVLMHYVGMRPVVVHGGGAQIGEHLKRLGIKSEFIAGLRVTDEETMEVTQMVLVGKVNKEIVGAVNARGGKAVGISGKDGGSIRAQKIDIKNAVPDSTDIPEGADLGMVGEVVKVDPSLIDTLQDSGFIPVIAPIGFDADENTYNINADHVASAVAGALKAEKLILLTDVPGILDEDKKLVSSLTEAGVREMIKRGTINAGMIPKAMCATQALRQGVHKVHIINGKIERALILEIFTDSGIGTEIVL